MLFQIMKSCSKSTGVKRLQEEYKQLKKDKTLASIQGSAAPVKKNDFLHWKGCLKGPKDTPYKNGLYYFEMKFTNEYPKKGPVDVQMRTKTYHPNINYSNGHICVSYFSSWKEEYNIRGILIAIHTLLNNPNPGSAYLSLNEKKAEEFNSKYATLDQEYNWEDSWGKGWEIND